LGLKKERIKGGKKRKRNSFSGGCAADWRGDFDVFASCLRQAAVITPQL